MAVWSKRKNYQSEKEMPYLYSPRPLDLRNQYGRKQILRDERQISSLASKKVLRDGEFKSVCPQLSSHPM